MSNPSSPTTNNPAADTPAADPSDAGKGALGDAKAVLAFFIRRADDARLAGAADALARRGALLGSSKTPSKIEEAISTAASSLFLEYDQAKKCAEHLELGEPRIRILPGAQLLFLASLRLNALLSKAGGSS